MSASAKLAAALSIALALSAQDARAEGPAYVDQIPRNAATMEGPESAILPDGANGSTGGNRARIEQRGRDNFASQTQIGANAARIAQTGIGNRATQFQHGVANEAHLLQWGDDNEAIQIQIGARNVSRVEQRGNGNRIGTHQNGTDNTIDTIQNGGEDTILIQYGSGHSITGMLAPGAAGVTVTQTGRGQDIVVTQY